MDKVTDYVTSLQDTQSVEDTQVLIAMMQSISGQAPKLWNIGTIGFNKYHYKYDSGLEGDAAAISFYPRKDKLTVYLMDGTARYSERLTHLGKHTTSRVCVYIKRLGDVDLGVLEQIVRESYEYVMSQDGHMHRAVE